MVDVIIVGGGPSGLSAALALGRCRRKVLIFDKGEPRNAASKGMHGFLTRDGIEPLEFLRLGREELRRYPSVEFRSSEIVAAECKDREFMARSESGEVFTSRILLLATGIVDELPPLPGIERFYGRSVHHCPYCDGWEHQDQPLAVFGEDHDCGETMETSVKGVFAIGNASRGLQLVIIAVAEGTKAAFAIDDALREADLEALRRARKTSVP